MQNNNLGVRFFNYADSLNKSREELKLPPHWLPGFVITASKAIKWFLKFFLYVTFVFFPFCFEIRGVASGSMTPTCQTNEWTLASKLGYGIRLSNFFQQKTVEKTFLDNILWQYSTPKLGDIIAFQVPDVDKESTYTKRIVGEEGDTVQFKNGILFINKKPVKLEFKKEYTYVENNESIHGYLYEETLPNGIKHEVLYTSHPGYGNLDYTAEFQVPKGCIFGVGDNRHNSDDCRSLLGFIEKRYIIGKVVMVLFSNGNLTSLNMKNFISGMRWNRCLKWMV